MKEDYTRRARNRAWFRNPLELINNLCLNFFILLYRKITEGFISIGLALRHKSPANHVVSLNWSTLHYQPSHGLEKWSFLEIFLCLVHMDGSGIRYHVNSMPLIVGQGRLGVGALWTGPSFACLGPQTISMIQAQYHPCTKKGQAHLVVCPVDFSWALKNNQKRSLSW